MHHNRITAGEPLTSAELAQEVEQAGKRQAAIVSRYDLRPNQPLTRERCAAMAVGSGRTIGALFSATDAQVADRLYQMFGGAK